MTESVKYSKGNQEQNGANGMYMIIDTQWHQCILLDDHACNKEHIQSILKLFVQVQSIKYVHGNTIIIIINNYYLFTYTFPHHLKY